MHRIPMLFCAVSRHRSSQYPPAVRLLIPCSVTLFAAAEGNHPDIRECTLIAGQGGINAAQKKNYIKLICFDKIHDAYIEI